MAWVSVAFIIIAIVYAAVGQAGASGYIAVMGLAPLAMKTTALSLNLVVAAIGTALFLKAGESHGGMFGRSRFWGFPSPCW